MVPIVAPQFRAACPNIAGAPQFRRRYIGQDGLWFNLLGLSGVDSLAVFFAYMLSAMGLAIVVVWPETGPGAFVREKILHKLIPAALHGLLDCYICFGFWTGLALSVVFWLIYGMAWMYFGCLMVPAAFWLVMGKWR